MNWEPVLECDDEEGNHTVWAKEVNSKKYGRYIWIEINPDNDFEVVASENRILVKCKSLVSAKRWVTINVR